MLLGRRRLEHVMEVGMGISVELRIQFGGLFGLRKL